MDETMYRVIMLALPKGHVFFSPHAAAGKASSSDLAYVQGDSSGPGGRNKKPVLASGASHIVQTSFSNMKVVFQSQSVSSNCIVLVDIALRKERGMKVLSESPQYFTNLWISVVACFMRSPQ